MDALQLSNIFMSLLYEAQLGFAYIINVLLKEVYKFYVLQSRENLNGV